MNADEIVAKRRRAGLTQAELAAALGVSKRTVGYWESRGVPPERVEQVAEALEVGPPLRRASFEQVVEEITRRHSMTVSQLDELRRRSA